MLKTNFKLALRYLTKNKGYTIVNIAGLAVGIATFLLIMLFVRSELSFNLMHGKADRIHRAWLEEHYQGEIFNNTATPIPLGPLLANNLPEVETFTRIAEIGAPIIHEGNTYNYAVTMVDSTLFEVFDFQLLKGNRENPFPGKNSIILSEETAKMLFGQSDPFGETLELQIGGENRLFTISGILEEVPYESSIRIEFLIPFSNAVDIYPEQAMTSGWSYVTLNTYVLLKEVADPVVVNSKIPAFMDPLVSKNYKSGEYNVRLQPLSNIHFNSTLPEELTGASNPLYSYILSTVGILILLIACINFITLSTGRSTTRAMEVGIRKVLGAERRQLISQFWGESFMISLFSMIVGVLLALLFLDSFNQLANREFFFTWDKFTLLFCFLLLLVITLFAGGYPALILSSFKPVKVLKGKIKPGGMGIFGKTLVISQFVASIVMIICTIVIGKQLNYLQSKDLGFNKEHVVVVPTNKSGKEGDDLAARYLYALGENPQIIKASASMYSMAQFGWMQLGYKDDQGAFRQFRFNAVDPDFVETMDLKVIQGRDFREGNAADKGAILVNEALVKQYGWKNPVGKKLPGKYPHEIIGVVEDFHIESLHTSIEPVVMAIDPEPFFEFSSDVSYSASPNPRVSVKFREGNLLEHIAILEKTWKEVAGDQEFAYRFLDDALNAAYDQERRLNRIVQYTSVLAIFITCLGLFGLATLVVARRKKEIGIRKVLGASVSTIVTTLNKDFVFQILLASAIAFPLAWIVLDRWFQDFTYRIGIPLWVFAVAALLVLIIALATVSIQSIKAALSNPVNSLRSE